MSKGVIRQGDSTSHGGTVVSAAESFTIMGKPVARIGDKVSCPLPGHGSTVISEGDPNWIIDGKQVALEGHKTSCGATLVSSLPNLKRG